MARHSGGGVILAGINRIGWRLNTQFIHNTAKANRVMTGTMARLLYDAKALSMLAFAFEHEGNWLFGQGQKEKKEKIGKDCTKVLDCTLRRGHWPLCHVLILPWYIYFPEGALGV